MSYGFPPRTIEAFDPEMTKGMAEAFEWAWDELVEYSHESTLPTSAIATRDLMAKRIVSMAQKGLHDRFRLASEAIAVVLASGFSPKPLLIGRNSLRINGINAQTIR